MSALRDAIHQMYVVQLYSVLVNNDPLYRRSLFKAGISAHARTEVPEKQRVSFSNEMALQAWLTERALSDANSLKPETMRTRILTGPATFYRVSDSKTPVNKPGIWWFSEAVAERCREDVGPDPKARLEWLRNLLAVCYNWSKFDRIDRFHLRKSEKIPAILGKGLPMPYNKLFLDRARGTIEKPNADYWKTLGETLLGGELQTVFPWVPSDRVARTPSLDD